MSDQSTTSAVMLKALRLVVSGAVSITLHTDDVVRATVVGFHDTYEVEVDPEGWHCSCPAGQHRRICSHVEAVALEVNTP